MPINKWSWRRTLESLSHLILIKEYTRLSFGVVSAPALFQRKIENLLQGLKLVSVHLDILNSF